MIYCGGLAGQFCQACRAALQGLAVVLQLDIASIEASHASIRRLLRGSSQTWTRRLAEISAYFIMMKDRIWEKLSDLAVKADGAAPPAQKKQTNTASTSYCNSVFKKLRY